MSKIFKFRKVYFVLTMTILIIEILIALFAHDRFIRPYFGDFLVVILVYCFLKSFINIPVFTAAIAALIFSYVVETLQYFNIVDKLGLQNSTLAKTVLGSSFEWVDLIAYTLGIIAVVYIENLRKK